MTRLVCGFLIIAAMGSCALERRKVRRLENKIASFKEEKEEVWRDSCMVSVSMSCYYADCAVTPIEIMQEKICRNVPEDL